MNRAWFILWALVIWQVGARAFAPAVPAPQMPQGDGKAFGANEEIFVEGRILQRKDAFRALDKPWSSFCTDAGRKDFVSGLSEYYYHRQNQTERYPEIHGKPGADYIARQWAAVDDKRIDRLTQEAYRNGYLKPGEFDVVARKMITTVVGRERITGKGCAG
jgi:hypothetical protein